MCIYIHIGHVFEREMEELKEKYEQQIELLRQQLSQLQEQLEEEKELLTQRYENEREAIEDQLAQQIREELEVSVAIVTVFREILIKQRERIADKIIFFFF